MPVIGVTLDEDWIRSGFSRKLTQVEREVLELSARRLSVKDIAMLMQKAESTIYTHRSRIVDNCREPGCASIEDVVARVTDRNVQFESELAVRRLQKQKEGAG